ncbi:hypothetical protein HK098_002804 [Nowakowskiella sp. JEL0407]|nr:hypothetical protein HK098_002804 [Nowakowskiella sp. JEL0407]
MSDSAKTFSQCWLAALGNDRGAWTLLSASVLMAYSYTLSNRKFLWNILLVNAISGIIGIIVQTSFTAVNVVDAKASVSNRGCNDIYPKDGSAQAALGYMLGTNEAFWYLNEVSIKVETVTKVTLARPIGLALRALMGAFVIAYLPLRIFIGYLRTKNHTDWDDEIGRAHAFAFIAWGLAELIIAGMLMQAAIYAKDQASVLQIIRTIFSSSIFRLLVISINQICIVIVSLIPKPAGKKYDAESVFEDVLWLIRGIYPMIMIVDILSTQTLLAQQSESMSKNTSNFQAVTYEISADPWPTPKNNTSRNTYYD